MVINVCEQCGESFEAGKPSRAAERRYCSSKCFGVSMYRRETKECLVCEKPFETGGRAGNRSQRFCSNECSFKARYRRGRKCLPLELDVAAYLAGFWDGDGSFIIHGRSDGKPSLAFRAQVGGTKAKVLEWLPEITGVGSSHFRESDNPKHASVWSWWCNGDAADSFTRQLIPYLRLKRAQAELGVEFQERLRDPALKADRSWQEEYRQRMSAMNKRGPIAGESDG